MKLAVGDNGEVGGMIQYIPIEHSFAEGKNLYFINCIWVHGYKIGMFFLSGALLMLCS